MELWKSEDFLFQIVVFKQGFETVRDGIYQIIIYFGGYLVTENGSGKAVVEFAYL